MARPTAQAQTAIDALKAAGFKRSEFKVRTERKWFTDRLTGKRGYEWGDAEISLRASKEKSIELIPAMLRNGLTVTMIYYRKNGELHSGRPRVSNEYTKSGIGHYIVIDCDKEFGNGRYNEYSVSDPKHPLNKEILPDA